MSRWAVLLLIRFYRRWLSRFTPHCPQTPICSTYALRAVRKYGAAEGLRLTAERLASCRPGTWEGGNHAQPDQHRVSRAQADQHA